MFSQGREQRLRASLDISPLLDVAFLLLIFFAVTTTFLEDAGLELDLPESTSAGPAAQEPVVVSVGADGTIDFRGRQLSAEELESAVAGLPPEELRRVTLRVDQSVDFGLVVEVFDALRRAGAQGLSVPTRAAGARGQGGRGPQPPDGR